MDIFSTTNYLYKYNCWYLLNIHNVEQYLSAYPYLQNKKIYAYCPYCHSVIRILERTNSKDFSLYAKHINDIPEGLDSDKSYADNCILRVKGSIFKNSLFKGNDDLVFRKVNKNNLRKDLSFLTGIYFSNKLVNEFLSKKIDAMHLSHVDQYNFPFALLLANESFTLNFRKIANPQIIKAIKDFQPNLTINNENQIILEKPDSLKMYFSLNKRLDNEWPSMNISIYYESDSTRRGLVFRTKLYCRFFKGVFD
ncbi:MAG: hypothetical protein HDS11_02980 [Bacteroides sp.]|nr:hypothetical protein [Bacteroides sp.]